MAQRWAGLLRRRGEEAAPVTSIELFFDLVYALAITQLTNYLLHDLDLPGAGRGLVLLLAVWWSWNDTAWSTNYFDPDRLPIRLVLIVLMLASLAMSGSLPRVRAKRSRSGRPTEASRRNRVAARRACDGRAGA